MLPADPLPPPAASSSMAEGQQRSRPGRAAASALQCRLSAGQAGADLGRRSSASANATARASKKGAVKAQKAAIGTVSVGIRGGRAHRLRRVAGSAHPRASKLPAGAGSLQKTPPRPGRDWLAGRCKPAFGAAQHGLRLAFTSASPGGRLSPSDGHASDASTTTPCAITTASTQQEPSASRILYQAARPSKYLQHKARTHITQQQQARYRHTTNAPPALRASPDPSRPASRPAQYRPRRVPRTRSCDPSARLGVNHQPSSKAKAQHGNADSKKLEGHALEAQQGPAGDAAAAGLAQLTLGAAHQPGMQHRGTPPSP